MMTTGFRLTQMKLIVAVLTLAIIVAVPALVSATVTLTVEGGSRSANVTDAGLESVNYSHDDQPTIGTIALTVDDSTASNDGWNVTVQAGDFIDGDRSIPAGNFAITSANAPAFVDGQPIDEANGPMVPEGGAAGSLDTPRKVLQANPDFGAGTYSQVLDVELTVPGQTPAGAYVSNLTVDITAGP